MLIMEITFNDESILSYPFQPVIIEIDKISYLIVPDFFKKISHVTFDDIDYIPSIVPEWLPFSIVTLNKGNYKSFKKFLKIITTKTNVYVGNKRKGINNSILTNYHKVNPKCPGSPRYFTYSFQFNDISNITERLNVIKDNQNKLFGIYYYHEKISEGNFKFHFIPISLFINIIEGGNTKVISLPFKNKKVYKIGKNKIVMDAIYNNNMRVDIPVDISLLIDGKLENNEIIKYNDCVERVKYYHLDKFEKYSFNKGEIEGFISSMDGNKNLYQEYCKLI